MIYDKFAGAALARSMLIELMEAAGQAGGSDRKKVPKNG